MENIEELNYNELRKLCREKGLEVHKKDTKEILIAKLKDYASKIVNRNHKLTNVRDKMLQTKRCTVIKNDPEDMRDSALISITNATGSYTFVVPFNTEIELPIPVIKNLQNAQVQKYKKVRTSIGTTDKAYMDKRYTVNIKE